MKSYSSASNDPDYQGHLEALSRHFSRLVQVLGPCRSGADDSRQAHQAITVAQPDDRVAIIEAYWGRMHAEIAAPILRQIDLSEKFLIRQQEHARDSAVE